MKLKFMNKMIAIMCAATVATSGVVTSVGAAGKTKAIEQIVYDFAELEQKQKELDEETSKKENWLKDKNRIASHRQKINNLKEDIKDSNRNIKINYWDKDTDERKKRLTESEKYLKKNRQNVIKSQSEIEKLKQKRTKENRNLIELINKNKKALKVIDRQIKDVKKQFEFMQAFQKLKDEIKMFMRWNASKNAGVCYTDVIVNKNIMTRCLELKNNFQAHRAKAIIQQIEKSIEAMKQYIKNYEEEHINENNQKNLVKDKNNETIKNSKMLGPSNRLVPLKMLGPSNRLMPFKMLGPSKRLVPQFKK